MGPLTKPHLEFPLSEKDFKRLADYATPEDGADSDEDVLTHDEGAGLVSINLDGFTAIFYVGGDS